MGKIYGTVTLHPCIKGRYMVHFQSDFSPDVAHKYQKWLSISGEWINRFQDDCCVFDSFTDTTNCLNRAGLPEE